MIHYRTSTVNISRIIRSFCKKKFLCCPTHGSHSQYSLTIYHLIPTWVICLHSRRNHHLIPEGIVKLHSTRNHNLILEWIIYLYSRRNNNLIPEAIMFLHSNNLSCECYYLTILLHITCLISFYVIISLIKRSSTTTLALNSLST